MFSEDCGPGANAAAYATPNGQTVYKLSDCVVNSATLEFDIDGITQITWSGFGTLLEQLQLVQAAQIFILQPSMLLLQLIQVLHQPITLLRIA